MHRERRRAELGGALFVVLAVVGVVFYFGHDPARGALKPPMGVAEETALGDEAARLITAKYGGEDPDPEARQLVAEVGKDLVNRSEAVKSGFSFHFHALADDRTVDAFASPGGHISITRGLLTRLESRGQLAGILAHQCAHVIARHWLRQVDIGGGTGPMPPRTPKEELQAAAKRLVDLRFSVADELEADRYGVDLMSQAGYDPRSVVEVLKALQETASPAHAEFLMTHPNPPRREEAILGHIALRFPKGLPSGLVR